MINPESRVLHRRTRAERIARGLTQQELAVLAGLSQTAVSAAERGISNPSVLEALAAALGVRDAQSLLDPVGLEVKDPE